MDRSGWRNTGIFATCILLCSLNCGGNNNSSPGGNIGIFFETMKHSGTAWLKKAAGRRVSGLGCGGATMNYTGNIDLKKYPWLKNKKIFIDPGHGGLGNRDIFRIGPGGITEEEANLGVALVLAKMLKTAGAEIALSRISDTTVSLEERVKKAREFAPHLLISIHHNGSPRRMDGVNYPCVLIWGAREVNMAGYELAELLLSELNKIMDGKGSIMSDFAVFPETGTMILRETRHLCPGVIGEGGFFSDEKHELHLKDPQYLQLEAESYFTALAEYLKRGIPTAEVRINCPLETAGFMKNVIREKSPAILITADSGAGDTGIDEKSFVATLDNMPVACRQVTNTLYSVEYGNELYPGSHMLRFYFANRRSQHSMIYSTTLNVEIQKGDYDNLVRRGAVLLRSRKTAAEGIKMLRSALSMGITDPAADGLLWRIAEGYAKIGDTANADYCRARLYYFYPQSAYRKKLGGRFAGRRYPVEYLGKTIDVKYDPALAIDNHTK